tara:strand:- start:426 stop:1163 length:738 start_codon:yes stop_codon:yes gene_type:complete
MAIRLPNPGIVRLSGVLANPKATTPVRIPLKSTKASAAKPQWKTPPDGGDTDINRYNKVEKAVQTVEAVDSVVSNVAAAAGGVSKVVSAGSKVAPALNFARAAGSKLGPVQAALWGVDAGRAVFDPAYRKKNLSTYNERMDDPNTSTLRKGVETGMEVLSRPVGATGAIIRSVGNASDTIKKNVKTIAQTDKKIAKYNRERESKKSGKIMEGQLSKAKDDHARKTPKMDRLGDQKPKSWAKMPLG